MMPNSLLVVKDVFDNKSGIVKGAKCGFSVLFEDALIAACAHS